MDNEAADRVVRFIETFCTHTKGDKAGAPFILEQWQKDDILRPLFGMKRKADGLRRYRTCYVEIPRKNGKSTWPRRLLCTCYLQTAKKAAR